MIKLVRLHSFLIAGAMLLPSGAAWAQPADARDIVISAPYRVDLEGNQRAVQFRDLALDRQSGQTALLHRVGYAIDSLCGNSVASANPVGALKCSVAAWDSVRPQLDQILKR